MNTWESYDYIPGDNKSGPWMKGVPRKTIRHKERIIVGRFGEIECAFDKAGHKFAFGKKLS